LLLSHLYYSFPLGETYELYSLASAQAVHFTDEKTVISNA